MAMQNPYMDKSNPLYLGKYKINIVALYLRKSRGDDIDCLSTHKRTLIEMCIKNSWQYVIYEEIANSEYIQTRPEMMRLLRDVEQGMYDAVLVHEFSRLGRGDLEDIGIIKRVFRNSETLIIDPQRVRNLEDDGDNLMVDIEGIMNNQEYRAIKRRLRQGKIEKAREGKWTNGIPPYPYVYQEWFDDNGKRYFKPKSLVINLNQKPIYRYIIEQGLKNVPPDDIAWELNKKEFPSPRGGTWSGVSVYRLLIDQTHLGRIVINKSRGDGHKKKKPNAKKAMRLPEEQWIVINNCHEPLKTEEEHEQLLRLISARKKQPHRARAGQHELSGILKCGVCGYGLYFERKGGEKTGVKPCWHRNEFGEKCVNRGKQINILDYINQIILDYKNELIEAEKQNKEKDNVKTNNTINSMLEIKYKTLEKYRKAFQKARLSYDLGKYSDEEWEDSKNYWCKEIDILEKNIEELEKSNQAKEYFVTNIERLQKLNFVLEHINDPNISPVEKNYLYKTVLGSVIWTRIGDEKPIIDVNFLSWGNTGTLQTISQIADVPLVSCRQFEIVVIVLSHRITNIYYSSEEKVA
ncbi:MAG: recombinase family protein [Clostridium sp.]|uniref:recombinase family protein n=1 Tax=Clostridium sp. TaxID=1506 RepID=UPI0025B960E1|nr:recombinase family protein [Clostridium sp.]MCE5220039.1 recombinase family protein [Clostridium sp.]